MANSGLFLVFFDSSILRRIGTTDQSSAFYSEVGTYLNFIDRHVAVAGNRPKIMLVATKTELENLDQLKDSKNKMLSIAKAQLTSL